MDRLLNHLWGRQNRQDPSRAAIATLEAQLQVLDKKDAHLQTKIEEHVATTRMVLDAVLQRESTPYWTLSRYTLDSVRELWYNYYKLVRDQQGAYRVCEPESVVAVRNSFRHGHERYYPWNGMG